VGKSQFVEQSEPKRAILAIDGPSGIGKSTLLSGLVRDLSDLNIPCVLWKNADDEVFGRVIREMAAGGKSHLTLTLALAAARARLLESDDGSALVLCDRFAVSSLVYQAYAGVPLEYVLAVNAPFLEQVTSIVLTTDERTLEERRAARAGTTDWFKRSLPAKEEISLYQSACQLLAQRSFPLVIVDASSSVEPTQAKLVQIVRDLLPNGAASNG
jgi:thymidylate kinase